MQPPFPLTSAPSSYKSKNENCRDKKIFCAAILTKACDRLRQDLLIEKINAY